MRAIDTFTVDGDAEGSRCDRCYTIVYSHHETTVLFYTLLVHSNLVLRRQVCVIADYLILWNLIAKFCRFSWFFVGPTHVFGHLIVDATLSVLWILISGKVKAIFLFSRIVTIEANHHFCLLCSQIFPFRGVLGLIGLKGLKVLICFKGPKA